MLFSAQLLAQSSEFVPEHFDFLLVLGVDLLQTRHSNFQSEVPPKQRSFLLVMFFDRVPQLLVFLHQHPQLIFALFHDVQVAG
jgi:hypothetical protein